MIFFITGLPRSRTKWFSHYFTHLPGVFCWHEAMNGAHTPEDLDARMSIRGLHVGNSDSGLMFSDFQQQYMGAPTLIVERDIDDVYQSLCRQYGPKLMEEGDGRAFLERQQSLLDKLSGLRVPFDEIDDRIEEIHHHLVPVPFDPELAETLINRNIQVENLTVDLRSYRAWVGG